MLVRKNVIFFLLALSISLVVCTSKVFGEEVNQNFQYEVTPVFTPEQQTGNKDYFYQVVQPEKTYTFTVTINNRSNTKETYTAQLNPAQTNKNGAIDYTNSQSVKVTTPLNTLTNNATQTVEIEANQSKEVTFEITTPKESFEGILLGAIYVTKNDNDTTSSTSEKSAVVFNQKLAYAVAIMLQEKVPYTQGNDLTLSDIHIEKLESQSALSYQMAVPTHNLIKNVSLNSTIYKKGSAEVYDTIEKKQMSFAPDNQFSLLLPWSADKMVPGSYRVVTTITSGDQTWKFENEFSISNKERKQVTDIALPIQENHILLLISLGVLFLVILILLVIIVYLIKRKK